MLKVIRGLLQVLLEFRSYQRIRPKAFVRPDHLEDTTIADFADSSKVLNQKVELRWPRNELYGLLWPIPWQRTLEWKAVQRRL